MHHGFLSTPAAWTTSPLVPLILWGPCLSLCVGDSSDHGSQALAHRMADSTRGRSRYLGSPRLCCSFKFRFPDNLLYFLRTPELHWSSLCSLLGGDVPHVTFVPMVPSPGTSPVGFREDCCGTRLCMWLVGSWRLGASE